MTSKPWKLDVSAVPEDKLHDARFISLRDSLQAALADERWKRAFAVHEGAHGVGFALVGRINMTIANARITYDQAKDMFDGYAASVTFDGQDQNILGRLTLSQWISGYAIACAAGGVAARVIAGAPDGGDEGDYDNLREFCKVIAATKSNIQLDPLALWKSAQDAVRTQLSDAAYRQQVEKVADVVYEHFAAEAEQP
jgi:hypothetical protein